MADPVAARFIGGQQPRAVTWRMMATMAGSWAIKGFGMFSVIDKASGLWLGRVGPWVPEGWPGTEIAWGLHPSAQGQGYAAEAATAAIDWAFEHLGWTEVIHGIDPENAPSERLAQRLGAVNRGPGKLPAPYEATVINIWGQTATAWKNRPRPDQA